MKKFAIILLLVLAACSQIEEQPLCSSPYFEWKMGHCCLDANNNGICDFDETTEEIIEEPVPSVNPIPELLEKAPSKYWFSTFDTGKVVVDGEKRHSFTSLDEGMTDIYWDEKKAWSLCDIQREILEVGQNFEIENAICNPNTLDIKEFKGLVPFGPIDWMKKYVHEIPIRIETSIQTIGVKTISPVLHFKENDGTITTLRFDYHFKVPVVVDQYSKNYRFKSTNYLFDTDFFLIGLDDNVDLPGEEKSYSLVEIHIEEMKLLLNDDVLIKGIVENKGSKYIPPQKIYIECYDKAGNMIGSKETTTFEGITAYKESEFKTYIPLSNSKDFKDCNVELV